jgi:hypothetical protein
VSDTQLEADLSNLMPILAELSWEYDVLVLAASPFKQLKIAADMMAEWLPRLNPIFAVLESFSLAPKTLPQPDMPFARFDGTLAFLILTQGFLSVRLDTAPKPTPPQRKYLLQRAQALIDLGKADQEPSHQKALAAMFDDTIAEIEWHRLRKGRSRRDHCPIFSAVMTALTTYVWRCQSLRAHLTFTSKLYEAVGDIVACVATPFCPACGGSHKFRPWRDARAWDKHKRQRKRDKPQG